MGNRPSNEAGDSADSDALSSDEERASGSPAVLQLPSGLRLMVNRDTRQIHLLGPDPEEDGDSDDEVYQEEVRMPPLSLLTRILGGPRHFTFTERSQCVDIPDPQPMPADEHFYKRIMHDTGQTSANIDRNICQQIEKRRYMADMTSPGQHVSSTMEMLPRHPSLADRFECRAFCGTYSGDGNLFLAATQDRKVYIYDTTGSSFKRMSAVNARDVGWSVLDVTFSPDQKWFAYSTWSPYVHVCSVTGDESHHYSLDMRPDQDDRFCVFSLRFSGDNKEILSAGSDGYLYVYDRERCERTMRVDAHEDDINAVAFADESSQVFYSGGDDGLLKIWDRRTLSEVDPCPVGIFAGHKDGIVFIDSKGDGRYAISNSKDQSIKLWDMRRVASREGMDATLRAIKNQAWDYRYQMVPKSLRERVLSKLPGDVSIMTYAGHWVKQTLCRCRFSPMFTTGQRYIYVGCASARVIIYDTLTAKKVETLSAPSCCTCVRDVSWHPYEPGLLVAATWDGYLQMWSHYKRKSCVREAHQRRVFDV